LSYCQLNCSIKCRGCAEVANDHNIDSGEGILVEQRNDHALLHAGEAGEAGTALRIAPAANGNRGGSRLSVIEACRTLGAAPGSYCEGSALVFTRECGHVFHKTGNNTFKVRYDSCYLHLP